MFAGVPVVVMVTWAAWPPETLTRDRVPVPTEAPLLLVSVTVPVGKVRPLLRKRLPAAGSTSTTTGTLVGPAPDAIDTLSFVMVKVCAAAELAEKLGSPE